MDNEILIYFTNREKEIKIIKKQYITNIIYIISNIKIGSFFL